MGDRRALNLASYNYLGFAEGCADITEEVVKSLYTYGVGRCSPKAEAGTCQVHVDLEKEVADFVGKPAACVFGMGFATNSTVIPVLCGPEDLIISDALNHSSIVTGARSSCAKVKTFRHNSPKDLERVLRASIAQGQPQTGRPWRKIIVFVEGIYSMEGEICRLEEIVELKKKYKAYLYVDEAHSIGALGATGRGVCEHCGVNPDDVEVLMGTFTKSFGSVGGYIAGSKELVDYLRSTSPGEAYASSMAPVCAQQALSAIRVILGKDGTSRGHDKIAALKRNSNMVRSRLKAMGCKVISDEDSPVIPVMLYNPAKMPSFSRECLKRNIATVVVGFPATPLIKSRVRFCISAAHKQKDLEDALDRIEEVCDVVMVKYARGH